MVLRYPQHPVVSTNIRGSVFVIFLEGVGGDWPLLTSSRNVSKNWNTLPDLWMKGVVEMSLYVHLQNNVMSLVMAVSGPSGQFPN